MILKLGFRVLGFRVLGFRVLGFRVNGEGGWRGGRNMGGDVFGEREVGDVDTQQSEWTKMSFKLLPLV